MDDLFTSIQNLSNGAIISDETKKALVQNGYNDYSKFGELGKLKEKNCLNILTENLKFPHADAVRICNNLKDLRLDKYDYNKNFHLESEENVQFAMLKARKLIPYLATFKGHCVTIVNRNLFVTYEPHSHASLDVGSKCGSKLNNEDTSVYQFPPVILFNGQNVNCTVIMTSKKLDCVWLKPDKPDELPSEIKQQQIEPPYYCQKVIIMGFSGIYQIETPISFDICNISCSTPDESGHVKSNKKSSPGESGGPIFDFYNGKLVGMMISSECSTGLLKYNAGYYGGKGEIVPSYLFFDYQDKSYDDLKAVKPVAFASRVNVRTSLVQLQSFDKLRKEMKEIIGNRVQEVFVSEDLSSSSIPCSIMFQNDLLYLEINPNHPIIVSLSKIVNEKSQDVLFHYLVTSLFDSAKLRAKDILKQDLNVSW